MSDECREFKIEQIDKAMQKKKADVENIKWYSPMEQPFRLSGFPWISRDRIYRRMPVNPEYKIPENVNILADCTAGGQIGFRTNSSKLILKVELTGAANMDHMPATGQCGFDCYIGKPGSQMYRSTVRYDHSKETYESQLFDNAGSELKDITLNFPLYKGVKRVMIGLEQDAEVYAALPYRSDSPIVFYGTSITQGGCAARPGMAYTNILSRRLNMECINLGFSGNGKGEPEVARIIAGIKDLSCYVLDYEGNANSGGILEKTLSDFIVILRATHPKVPILVVSKIRHAKEIYYNEEFEILLYLRDFQRNTVEAFRAKGDVNVHFYDGMELLGENFDECTVDGVHPTDLGFWRIAEKLEPVIRRLVF